MPSQATNGTFDTTIKSWLSAMEKAKRIKPGGKLVFVNRKTKTALPTAAAVPTEGVPQ